MRHWRWYSYFVWVLLVVVAADKYAYELNEFNTKTRVFLLTGATAARQFDDKGLPVSWSARTRQTFVSPFYVVHYGILYSEAVRSRVRANSVHWRADPSLPYWNVPPSQVREDWFRNSADWVVANLNRSKGVAHLMYHFDWRYPEFPGGALKAPWWSGLTDGYAIILLLRAYDAFGDESYLRAARDLYESVLTPVSRGGSMNSLNGLPWIEEYVDPRIPPDQLPYVLNGMIYAAYGVESYERHASVARPVAPSLFQSIASNIEAFDMGRWSAYDAIGTANSIKYHRIHVALLDDLITRYGHTQLSPYHRRWLVGAEHPGWYWLTKADFAPALLHFVVLVLLIVALPAVIWRSAAMVRSRRSRSEG